MVLSISTHHHGQSERNVQYHPPVCPKTGSTSPASQFIFAYTLHCSGKSGMRPRNVFLTDRGVDRVEHLFDRGSLYDPENLHLLIALQKALHAECLLDRDVDYIVRGGKVELVDDFTGRVADRRRWPDGLQAAIECRGVSKSSARDGSSARSRYSTSCATIRGCVHDRHGTAGAGRAQGILRTRCRRDPDPRPVPAP